MGLVVAEARSKVTNGTPASLAARTEAPIAAASSARAMTMLTFWFRRSSMFEAWRAGSASATLIFQSSSIPAGGPCRLPSLIR